MVWERRNLSEDTRIGSDDGPVEFLPIIALGLTTVPCIIIVPSLIFAFFDTWEKDFPQEKNNHEESKKE